MIIEFSGLNERLYHPLHGAGEAPPTTEEGVKRMQKLEDREECCEVMSFGRIQPLHLGFPALYKGEPFILSWI